MKQHFEQFKKFGTDGCYDVFSVVLVTEKRKLFSRRKVYDRKTLFISDIDSNFVTSRDIKRRYDNLQYYPSGKFLSKRDDFDQRLKEFVYSGILYLENDKDPSELRKYL